MGDQTVARPVPGPPLPYQNLSNLDLVTRKNIDRLIIFCSDGMVIDGKREPFSKMHFAKWHCCNDTELQNRDYRLGNVSSMCGFLNGTAKGDCE